MERKPGQDAASGKSVGTLRKQYAPSSTPAAAGAVHGLAETSTASAGSATLQSTCSFSDSESGQVPEGSSLTPLPQISKAHAQQVQPMPVQQSQHVHAGPKEGKQFSSLVDVQQQTQPQTQLNAEVPKESGPARVIRPHLSRAAVSRSLLHYIAKAFGVHLQGAVATNEISTAKYTLLTFLPVNLFEQFLRVANLYFLLMVILQLIPGLSPTSLFTTVAPLVFVLLVNAIKEGYDDVHRHRNDNQINNRLVLLLSKGHGEQEVYWKDIVAGDLVKVRVDEEVPADLVLLSSADADNLCYVETANLDGETNLKIKYCWSGFVGRKKVDEFEQFVQTCVVGCEPPNPKLYAFDGYMEVTSTEEQGNPTSGVNLQSRKEPLDINNLLLRGSILRKTDWVVGLAISVGSDSKIVQNMTKAPRKVTQLERAMNALVFVQFSALLVFAAVLAGLDQLWTVRHIPESWYLQALNKWPEVPPSAFGWFVSLLRFIILLSNMIPISLYVSLELVKVFQCALLLNQDREMYHKETDTPFVCRTTTLNEELGQVQYVLSDKTGTLTQNVMGFVWASVAGRLYGKAASEDNKPQHVPDHTPHTIALDTDMQKAAGLPVDGKAASKPLPDMDRFLMNLAVCNTVVPSVADNGNLQYQASSPDEEALVQGAAYLGYKLISRTTEEVRVEVHGSLHVFDILATLEFNSDRKRMSTIVRTPDNRVLLMCKGADSIILKRLHANEADGIPTVMQHLDDMARAGYRTLLVADRQLGKREYEEWQQAYSAASVALDDREGRMAAEQSRIETDLCLVGATAVEDKLQDGVPDCLQALAHAGIKVWVLTGDKVETAISIAYSCKLFTEDMGILEMREADFREAHDDDAAIIQVLKSKAAAVQHLNAQMHVLSGHTNVGIVIEGGALHAALAPGTQDALMALCKECKSVVCCRVTPMQKAQITLMVKKKAGAITLGIGDGANDVGMIRAAHIGVGISGREGRAAVLASDFSFAQFRFLSRLLLLHGRWSYIRNKEVVLYSFYKNWAYVLVYVYLQFEAGFSAVPIFTTMMISTFNMIFTACPIVAYAVLEKDLEKQTVLDNPESYGMTRTATRAGFFWNFLLYVYVVGTWHSLPVYFLPWYALASPDRTGLHGDLSALGTAVFIALTTAVTLKLSLRTHCWNWITHLVYWLSLALLFPFVYVISILWASTAISGVADMSGVGVWLFRNAIFWLTAVSGACAIALLPDLAVMLFKRYFKPDIATLLQEQELRKAVAEASDNRKQGPPGPFNGQHTDSPGRHMPSSPKPTGIPCMPCLSKQQQVAHGGIELQVTPAAAAGAHQHEHASVGSTKRVVTGQRRQNSQHQASRATVQQPLPLVA